MARTTRAAVAASRPVQEEKVEEKMSKSIRKVKAARRRNLYNKAKRAQQIQAIKTALQVADDPATKKELSKLRGQIFKPRKTDSEQLQKLKILVRKQQKEIEGLRKTMPGADVPRLEPPASPTVEEAGEEPDSSPVKIQQQLLLQVAHSSNDRDAEPEAPSTALEVEEIVEETTENGHQEQMEGVEMTTVTTTTATNNTTITTQSDIEYPTLPTVEANDAANEVKATIEEDSSPERQEANVGQSSQAKDVAAESGQVTPKLSGTPLKPTEHFRDSSADSNAGTPRNVRRSPRKRTKRRSFAGHSYAV